MAKDSKYQSYVSPLVERNASAEMAELFGYKTESDKPDGQAP
jgi:hypothetical protein